MMIIARNFLIILLLVIKPVWALAYDGPDLYMTTDTRIRTYVYNPNEVYLLTLHHGFQSQIEFAKGEEIQTISLGDTYSWKLTTIGHRLFIRPLEKDILTNMTIITNKRTYQFDLVSKNFEAGDEKDLVYLIKFFYPKKNSNMRYDGGM